MRVIWLLHGWVDKKKSMTPQRFWQRKLNEIFSFICLLSFAKKSGKHIRNRKNPTYFGIKFRAKPSETEQKNILKWEKNYNFFFRQFRHNCTILELIVILCKAMERDYVTHFRIKNFKFHRVKFWSFRHVALQSTSRAYQKFMGFERRSFMKQILTKKV